MNSMHYIDLVLYRGKAEIKRDSSGMYLGILWWVLEPLIYMSVFYLIFGLGLKNGGIDFVFYLLCGLVPWKWLDSTVRTSSGVILGSAGLMRQAYFPKWILPGYVIVANFYKFVVIFLLLMMFLLVAGVKPAFAWWFIPVILIVQFLFNAALALLAAAIVPLIPDVRHLVNYGMTMLFFISGIFFDVSDLSDSVSGWLTLVPTVILIDIYREVILYGLIPPVSNMVGLLVWVSCLMLLGVFLLKKYDRYYPRVVV